MNQNPSSPDKTAVLFGAVTSSGVDQNVEITPENDDELREKETEKVSDFFLGVDLTFTAFYGTVLVSDLKLS